MAILTVHKTITVPETVEAWLKSKPNLNHSKLITDLLLDYISLHGSEISQENIDRLILAKEAELNNLNTKRGDLSLEQKLQEYFTELPDEKKTEIIEFANNSGASTYWVVVKKQKAFELKYHSKKPYWLHGLTNEELEALNSVLL